MINLIAAIDAERGIGSTTIDRTKGLLWDIPGDLKRFKEITMGHPIIMGRKTFEPIGRALPGRMNIVVTRDVNFTAEGVNAVHSLEEAVELAQQHDNEIFIIGGGQLFAEGLPLADRIYATLVEGAHGADVFFPEFEDQFARVELSEPMEENGETYRYATYERQT